MKNAVKTFVFYISVYIVSSRRIRQQENCFFILKFIIENFSETVSKKKNVTKQTLWVSKPMGWGFHGIMVMV